MKAVPENIHEASFSMYLYNKGHSSKTLEINLRHVHEFIKWLATQNIEVETVGYSDVTGYIQHCKARKNKAATIQKYLISIKHYYTHLQAEELVADNPASNIEIKGVQRNHLYEILSYEALENLYKNYPETTLAQKRNRIIVGLLVYQGIRSEDLTTLTIQDVKVREGQLHLQGGRRYNERILTLESHQIIELQEYLLDTRKQLLALTGKITHQLFISYGTSTRIQNLVQQLLKQLKKQHPRLKNHDQIRASVITGWIKNMNLRKAQYLAGHRYISSTEAYKVNDIEGLQEEINNYHPLG